MDKCGLEPELNSCKYFDKDTLTCSNTNDCSMKNKDTIQQKKEYVRKERWYEKYYK